MITEIDKALEKLSERKNFSYEDIHTQVEIIINDVKLNGDEALLRLTEKFDNVILNRECIKVPSEEIDAALKNTSPELISVIRRAAERIEAFHLKQRQNSWFEPSASGEILGQIIRPIESVGVYVPGGKAAYPSSVLMNVIPAKIAGVERIVLVTPPQTDGKVNSTILAAAAIAGADEVYGIGGAQAIAALAYGTQTINKVDKIVGPGNVYVALAKKSVFGEVGIDSVAGPSEILIIADETADPSYIAADMLSQAEHDELAAAILISTSKELLKNVETELTAQLAKLPRKEIAETSLNNYGIMVHTETLGEAFSFSNKVAPEHLEICVKDPFIQLTKVKHAGAVFLGNYTPEPLGDYMAGPNHVLPTYGTARFFSALSVDDFIKKTSVLSFSQEAMEALGGDIIKFAEAEGLGAHANSVRIRLDGCPAKEV